MSETNKCPGLVKVLFQLSPLPLFHLGLLARRTLEDGINDHVTKSRARTTNTTTTTTIPITIDPDEGIEDSSCGSSINITSTTLSPRAKVTTEATTRIRSSKKPKTNGGKTKRVRVKGEQQEEEEEEATGNTTTESEKDRGNTEIAAMAIYDIGETIVYQNADGSEAVGVIKSISDPLTDSASAMYEIEDVDTGDKSTIHESRILGSMDFDT